MYRPQSLLSVIDFNPDIFERIDLQSSLRAAGRDLERIKNGRFSLSLCVPGLFESDRKVEILMQYVIDYKTLKKNGYEAILLTERLNSGKLEERLAKMTPGEQPYLILPKHAHENCTLLVPTAKNKDSKNF